MDLDERAAYVALALTPGIGCVRLDSLLQHAGSALGALSAPFAFLEQVPGISRAAASAVASQSLEAGRRALAATEAIGAVVLLPADPGFPAALTEIPDRPTLIFALGRLDVLALPGVAMVGSRDHSPYGGEVCRQLATGAAEAGLAVVSGMARGLDAVAHQAALDAGGATIGVLGNGLGVIYPAANRGLYLQVAEAGLLLTEFPPGERPVVGSFPRRNRLISALARVTVVIEAAEGSGALITVGTALAQGRDVMVVPGNITSRTSVGANRLIRDGAEPLLELGDLLAHYPEVARAPAQHPGATRASAPPPDLSPAERSLFDVLSTGSAGPDDLILRSGLSAPVALVALSGLELRGVIQQVRGRVELVGQGGGRREEGGVRSKE